MAGTQQYGLVANDAHSGCLGVPQAGTPVTGCLRLSLAAAHRGSGVSPAAPGKRQPLAPHGPPVPPPVGALAPAPPRGG